MSGFRSSQAYERAHADVARPRRRSRCVSGLSLYQSMGWAMSVFLDSWVVVTGFRMGLVELALGAAHRRRPVVPKQEAHVLAEHLPQVGRHHDRRDGAEGEPLLRVHQLLLVAEVERGLLALQPVARLLLGVL